MLFRDTQPIKLQKKNYSDFEYMLIQYILYLYQPFVGRGKVLDVKSMRSSVVVSTELTELVAGELASLLPDPRPLSGSSTSRTRVVDELYARVAFGLGSSLKQQKRYIKC